MSITVLKSGNLTTIQDLGRFGYASQGFRTCGAADFYSFKLANLLAGNGDENCAALEFTLQGGQFKFNDDTIFALTGAFMPAFLNDKPVDLFKTIFAPAGSVLSLDTAKNGLRTYLAVYGGINTPLVLSSRSTDLKCHIGGLNGNAIKKDDILPVLANSNKAYNRFKYLKNKGIFNSLSKTAFMIYRPYKYMGFNKIPLIRTIKHSQSDFFTQNGLHTFTHSVYKLTPDCDRMGCKLIGDNIEIKSSTDIISDGIVTGDIQVSNNGQPIVMLSDHQTTGGYAKIATVITADIGCLAQMRPGEKLAFTYVSLDQAISALKLQLYKLKLVKEKMK